MNKFLMIACALVFSTSAFAVGPAPKELRGGKIVVTLADGQSYTFSSDEYAVVKRGEEEKTLKILPVADVETEEELVLPPETVAHKNIVSLGVVRSQQGFNVSSNPSVVSVETKNELAGQLQYQRLLDERLYLGGQIDTNGGVGANLGVGF
jgi:hypothetical protein